MSAARGDGQKNKRNELRLKDGTTEKVLVECGAAEGLPGEEEGFGGVCGETCTAGNCNGRDSDRGKENVTVRDWLDRTRRAFDSLQGLPK